MNTRILLFVGLLWLVCSLQEAHSQPPAHWTVNPGLYQYSMTFTSMLKFNGKLSEDPNDVVAAFVNGQCRGRAQPSDSISSQYPNLAFLMVYSNQITGDTVTFHLYDADKDSVKILPHRSVFRPNAAYGLPSQPLVNMRERRTLIAMNVFTPNNDGHNDVWRIKNRDIYIDYDLYVYDAHGVEVFHKSESYENDWDGRHQGRKLPQGVYYYVLRDAGGKSVYAGTISLVR